MNGPTLSKDDLKAKISSNELQIKKLGEEMEKIDKENINLRYLFDNFDSIVSRTSNTVLQQAQSLFPQLDYDSSRDTKELILDILEKEKRPMTGREIYSIFHGVKPDIRLVTVRVSLSQMNKGSKYPIKLIKNGNQYHYILEENKSS